jgi:hypothetical protein
MIPRWLPKALLALLLLLLALAAIWFGLLKPTIRSAAKDAVDKPAQQAQLQAAAAQEQARKAGAAAQNAAGAATDANMAADRAATLVNTPRAKTISGPLSSRLERVLHPPPGQQCELPGRAEPAAVRPDHRPRLHGRLPVAHRGGGRLYMAWGDNRDTVTNFLWPTGRNDPDVFFAAR